MGIRRRKQAFHLNSFVYFFCKPGELPPMHFFAGILPYAALQACLLGGTTRDPDNHLVGLFLDFITHQNMPRKIA